jgi:hypothetical protein
MDHPLRPMLDAVRYLVRAPPRMAVTTGRPPRHGSEFAFGDPATWQSPHVVTITEARRYGSAAATAWDRLHQQQA